MQSEIEPRLFQAIFQNNDLRSTQWRQTRKATHIHSHDFCLNDHSTFQNHQLGIHTRKFQHRSFVFDAPENSGLSSKLCSPQCFKDCHKNTKVVKQLIYTNVDCNGNEHKKKRSFCPLFIHLEIIALVLSIRPSTRSRIS